MSAWFIGFPLGWGRPWPAPPSVALGWGLVVEEQEVHVVSRPVFVVAAYLPPARSTWHVAGSWVRFQ